jgi:hypothetical protein
MTEREPIWIVQRPTRCVLWEHPDHITGKFAEFLDEVGGVGTGQ